MKKIIALMLTAFLFCSFAGCSPGNSSSETLETSSPSSSFFEESSSSQTNEASSSSSPADSSSEESSSKEESSSSEESSSNPESSSSASSSSVSESSSVPVSSSNPESSSVSTQSSESSSEVSSNTTSSQASSDVSSDTVTSDETSSGLVSSNTLPPKVPVGAVNPADYHCYSFLSDNGKIIYNSLLSAANRMDSSWLNISVSGKVSVKDVSLVFHALQTDHPELFWLPSQYYIKTKEDSLSFLFVRDDSLPETSTYLIKKSQKDAMVSSLKNAVEEIKSQVTATVPSEIALQLHDLLCARVKYLSGSSKDPMLWTAYGALVNGEAVCEGYARAYQLLLYEFGINSTLVTGTANGEGHMWNIVNIDGKNYHVDVTWDDRNDGGSPSFHAYFCLTDTQITATHSPYLDFALIKDEEFESDHALNYNFNIPECRDDSLNYFENLGAVFSYGEEEALADYIISKGGTVEIKYIDNEPETAQVNKSLSDKGSALRIKRWYQKTSAPVIILEVSKNG